MFFRVDEKTIADMIKNQQKREEKRSKAEESVTYKNHKLTFAMSVDGHLVILSDPPLIREAEDQGQNSNEPTVQVDVFSSGGWKTKSN